MKLYRNHYSVEGGGSGGFSWHTSKRAAKAAVKDFKTSDEKPHAVAELIVLKRGKANMVTFLNHYAGHPDNG